MHDVLQLWEQEVMQMEFCTSSTLGLNFTCRCKKIYPNNSTFKQRPIADTGG